MEKLNIAEDQKKNREEREAINAIIDKMNAIESLLKKLEEEREEKIIVSPYKVPVMTIEEKNWKPVGDGQKFWTDPKGVVQPVDQVPDEYLEPLTQPDD